MAFRVRNIQGDTKPKRTNVNAIATELLLADSARRQGDTLTQKHQIEKAQLAFDKALLSKSEAWSKERQKLQKDLAETAAKLSQSEDQSDLVELYQEYVAEGNVDAATAIAAVIKEINPQIVLEASERDLIAGSPDSEALKRGKFGAELNPFEKARQAGLTEEEQKETARIEGGLTGSFTDKTAQQEADTKQFEAETKRMQAEELPEKQQLAQYVLDNAEALGLDAAGAGVVAQQILGGEETTEQMLELLFEKIDTLGLDEADALKRKADIVSATGGVKMGETGSKTDFASTQEILDKYTKDTANNRAFNSIANMISSKDARQTFTASADRYAKGRSFADLSKPENNDDKEGLGRLMVQEIMENAPGGEIVKRHLRTQELLKVHLPEIMKTIDDMKSRGIDLGKFTAAAERTGQFFGNTTNAEVAKLNTRIKDLVAAFVALRSGAQVTEQERQMYTDIFSQMGRGYELNKAVIDGLLTNVMVELGSQYSTALGKDWGDYMVTLDFAPGEISPVQYETPDRTEVVEEPGEGSDFIFTNEAGEQFNVDNEIRMMIEEDKYNREQIENQLKEWYPTLTDEQIMELLDKHFGG